MSAEDKVYRDDSGRIIGYPSNPDKDTALEVQLARTEGRLDRIESNLNGNREETKEVHEKVDKIMRDISTMTNYYRETLNKQEELKNDIHCKPGGLVCRVESTEKGLSGIFVGIKTAVTIITIVSMLSGIAFGLAKLTENNIKKERIHRHQLMQSQQEEQNGERQP